MSHLSIDLQGGLIPLDAGSGYAVTPQLQGSLFADGDSAPYVGVRYMFF